MFDAPTTLRHRWRFILETPKPKHSRNAPQVIRNFQDPQTQALFRWDVLVHGLRNRFRKFTWEHRLDRL